MSTYVKSYGPLSSPLWVIGDSPSLDECQAGVCFVGSKGRFLKEKFVLGGIDANSVYYTLLYHTKPGPKNFGFDQIEYDTASTAQLVNNVVALKCLIKQHRPHLVLCLGKHAAKYIMGMTALDKIRGHIFFNKELDCKTLATYDPQTCIRQRFAGKANKPGSYEVLFQQDVLKAVRNCESEQYTPRRCNIHIPTTYAEQDKALRKLENEAAVLAFDIECDENFIITCISFAPSLSDTYCFPLCSVQNGGQVVYQLIDKTERLDIYWRIKQLLQSSLPKIAQNSQFDMSVLWKIYGIRTCNLVWDTMVAMHNTFCDLPKDLGTLMSLYSDFPYHKSMYEAHAGWDFWEYNARDSVVTLDIASKQVLEMKELGIYDHYINVTNPLLLCLVEMLIVGIKVDETCRDYAIARENLLCNLVLTRVQELISPDFNINSPQQMKELLYERLGLPQIYKDGKVTTSKGALQELADRYGTGATGKPVLKTLLTAFASFKKSRHLISVLSAETEAGRMHTAYNTSSDEDDDNAAGASTGRLVSRASIFGSGMNLQNLQVGYPRKMLVAG